MATATHKLDGVKLSELPPGKHSDGGGLSLIVKPSPKSADGLRRSWSVRYRNAEGKQRDLGLGSFPGVDLAGARHMAAARTARDATEQAAGRRPKGPAPVPTFAEAIPAALDMLEGVWKNPTGERRRFENMLHTYAGPLMDMKLTDITHPDVLAVLRPTEGSSVLRKLNTCISQVFDEWALMNTEIDRNPTHMLKAYLKRQRRTRKVEHHAAIDYRDLPAAVKAIDASPGWPAMSLCLRFAILTGTRSGEARLARWAEIDFDAMVWTIPADRMKAGREHRVPLSRQAIDVLIDAKALGGDRHIFPSHRIDSETLSSTGLRSRLRAAGITETVHGMRSAFSDWAVENGYDRDIADKALAHGDPDAVRAAYQRTDLFDLRRSLMQSWADYIG